jgi:hypothetical protein
MEKKGSTFGVLVLIVLIVVLGALIYLLYLNWPREPVEFKQVIQQDGVDEGIEYSSSKQFYDSMRYKDKAITYYISSSCDDDKRNSMVDAFSILQEKTILSFIPVQENQDIHILCSDVGPEAGQEDYFVAGEGGPSRIINSTLYSVILSGKIALFREDSCPETKIAVHELLHALGFDHNDNPRSILYPTLECDQEIDNEIIDDINRLYSVNPKADFKFFKVDASKGGRYLNFEVEVLNQGIIDGENVMMTIYQGEKKVDDFVLGSIEVGARKILTVENLKLPNLSGNEISFLVDDGNDIEELFENNNRVDLVLSSRG